MTIIKENDDKQLLELISLQQRSALEDLYDRYANTVYSLAMHMLRDAGQAEEVTQDVFFNVWRRAASYNAKRGSVTAWLFSIAHHRTIDELRKRRRDQTHVQQGGRPNKQAPRRGWRRRPHEIYNLAVRPRSTQGRPVHA